jgi:N-acetylmuramoyl-L-alanine amidase
MRQTLRHRAATIRLILRVLFAAVAVLSLFSSAGRADNNSSSRREQAKSQFERAEKARQDLEARPENARTPKEYMALVIEYQRVYLITSHAAEVPTALNEVAQLFRTMGDLFDAKYYQRSIESFQFLMKQYPASKYREDAPLAIARIEQDDLHDPVLAQKTYEQFLALHPRSAHAAEVRAALDKLASQSAAKSAQTAPAATGRTTPKAVSADQGPPTTDTKQGSPEDASGADDSSPRVSRIRAWNADNYTRIVIDVGSKVKYQAARISGPDRIYFDIEGTKLSAALLHKPIDVDGSAYLKTVRVAQNQMGVVRVVLEVNRVADYSVFLLPDPYRLVVDVYGNVAAAEAAARNTAPLPGPTTTDAPPVKPEKPAKETTAAASPKAAETVATKSASGPALSAGTPAEAQSAANKASANSAKKAQKTVATHSNGAKTPRDSQNDGASMTAASTPDADILPLPAHPASPTTSLTPLTKKSSRTTKSAHEQAEEMGPAATPELTRDGQHSLTRALGLKIGRIVIDAGHGGRDTGTIGPTGLMEKDLCLDVALRLGKIIQLRLPGADVVFTRDDDTFIALERRTEIANQAKADLFISVHANSSQDRQARGIETYYLNLTGSSDAMEVASRENALSENGVHDLQDIVAKIARNEKIEESRDLAAMVQDSLAKRMESFNRGDRNRGVRKAPFVVLIGADMPSVLAEISFISNPSDEQWLKKPENRQRVADGLYHGIESYLHSTNSLAANQARSSAENLPGKVARAGNSQ